MSPEPTRRRRLAELAGVFLRLGTTAFGGPAVHIAMMEEEVVRRRRWLTQQQFLDLLAATHLIPGPNSTEMAIHIGMVRAGWAGLLVAGTSFILPAALIVTAIAWAYQRFGKLPPLEAILYGIKPVIIAVVLQALWGLARSALKSRTLVLVGWGALVLNVFGVHELLLLLLAGLLMLGLQAIQGGRAKPPSGWLLPPLWKNPVLAITGAGVTAPASFGLWPMFWFFLKVGSVLYGSGYVLLAFLRGDLVERLGWLTESQLLDAIAIGQVTPGPVFTTATFIGFILAGVPGAALATLGIFLPAFVFVALSGQLIPRLRESAWAAAALDGVVVASLALMGVVTWQLARSALVDGWTIVLAVGAVLVLLRWKVNSIWMVLGGALVGIVKLMVR